MSVNTNRDCSWSAQSTVGWIHLQPASGQGTGTITYRVDENNAFESRGGAIQVSSAGAVSITQEGEPPPPPPPPPPPASPSPQPSPVPSPGPGPTPTPPVPDAGRRVDIEGAIVGLSGSCPNISFTVAARLVRTNADTEFKEKRCTELRNGTKVKVRGVVQPDGSIIATRVEKD